MTEIIQRGAEALLYLSEFEGEEVLVKDRIKKNYRIPVLDKKIRVQRTKRECILIEKAGRVGVLTPEIIDSGESRIVMEFLEGEKLKDVFNTLGRAERLLLAEEIGKAVGKLHSADIIHGDLTTSNMILEAMYENRRLKQNGKSLLFLIDFGMGKISKRVEDKAVDLYLLHQSLISTHFRFCEETWERVLNVYKQNYLKSNDILKRLQKIEKRRRYT